MHEAAEQATLRELLLKGLILPVRLGEKDRFDRTGLSRFTLAGWQLRGPMERQPLFMRVDRRPDWAVVRPMEGFKQLWFEICDGASRPRGHIFYFPGTVGLGSSPPAAHAVLLPRFKIERILGQDQAPTGVAITDAGRRVQRFGNYPDIIDANFRTSGERETAIQNRVRALQVDFADATAWLAERAPLADDVLAYWGEQDREILGLPPQA